MLFFSLLSEFIFICVGSNIMWLFLGRPLLLTWLHQCLNCRTNTNKGLWKCWLACSTNITFAQLKDLSVILIWSFIWWFCRKPDNHFSHAKTINMFLHIHYGGYKTYYFRMQFKFQKIYLPITFNTPKDDALANC
jgi:hypothetical protein